MSITRDLIWEIAQKKGKADLLIARHVMEHAVDATEFLLACHLLLNPGGLLVLEVPDCSRALALCDYTVVWEEHNSYFTDFTFREFLRKHGCFLLDYQIVPYPMENSLVAVLQFNHQEGWMEKPESQKVHDEICRVKKFATLLDEKKRPPAESCSS